MKKNYIVLILFLLGVASFAQELYVGSDAEFYLKKEMDFTTSNTIVTLGATGKFSVEAGSLWGNAQEYVNGKVYTYGSGETKLPVGNNGVYAPVFINHSINSEAQYFNSVPTSGTYGANVDAVSEEEYWTLNGQGIVTLPWIPASDITSLVNDNGGSLNSVAVVGLNGGTWNLVSATQTNSVTGDLSNGTVTTDSSNEVVLSGFSEYTFGIDHQVVLGLDDLFLNNEIRIISNPIDRDAENIYFVSENLDNLEVAIFDFLGRKISHQKNISVSNNRGAITKPNLNSGLYLLKFEHEGKKGTKKILIK
ncbi:T9SS C-terminal target domain-containing protein [Aureibaculum marinum]|uniref:T9SS C-terminal target domain-containing protein n=1 Tax=Aureibaculum marinum TaxID=2487930 RepID=A0A3N4NJM5_9FLAO|nr:T9SS type A sorting domain-containing protein [Aureibaculum marinum]RPD94607.1 T9SS C-terminal target domain-containing protein [Aureibaculum marinum]